MRRKYFYGYYILAAGFIMQGICYGAMFTYGLFFNEFQTEFGWSRATISGASSLCFLIGGALGVPAGRLNDKIGPKALSVVVSILFGLGYLLLSRLQTPWQLYLLYGFPVALGFGAFDVITLSTVSRWFVRSRGMMSGVVKVGTGSGQILLPLFAAALIAAYGWRNTYIILGVVFIVLLVAAAQAMRLDPGEMGLLPDNDPYEPSTPGSDSRDPGMPLKEIVRTKQFWAINLAEFCSFFCVLTIVVHIVPHAIDRGLAPGIAAGVISAIGGMSIIGRLVLGSASDRIGGKRALMICFVILFISFIWLQVAGSAWMFFLFAVVYGFAHGGLFTVVSPTVAELFGTGSHGLLFGIVLFSGNIGGSISPFLAGRLFDVMGSYRIIFFLLAVMSAIGFVLISLLRPLKRP
jgi:MFS transporter, OFA family, oxalate/formate antiporter